MRDSHIFYEIFQLDKMSEYHALIEAASALVLDAAPPLSCPAVSLGASELILAQQDNLNLLRGKRALALAAEGAGREEIQERVKTADNVMEDFTNTVEDTVLQNQILSYMTQSISVKELFSKPSSRLTAEEAALKDETLTSMQQLQDIEVHLASTDAVIREKERQIRELRGEWGGVLTDLRNVNLQVTDIGNVMEVDNSSEYVKLQKYVTKMELIREFMKKFLPIATSKYDWSQDNANLMGYFSVTREPITMETFTNVESE